MIMLWQYAITVAHKPLHFLNKLKRINMFIGDLLCYYRDVISLIIEYACRVWHSGLTNGHGIRVSLMDMAFGSH
jgi:hypothetical protein